MKGIVVEINNKDVAVLSDDGVVSKVQNNSYKIGQVIVMKKMKKNSSKLIAGVASFVATIAIFTIGGFAYYTPTDYVSLDVNPSIEYSVNMFDRVIDVKAVNDDGEEILKSLFLDNQTIKEAVKLTLAELINKGYLTDDEDGGVIITTSNSDTNLEEAEKMAKELKVEIQAYIDEQEQITAKVETEAVGKIRVEEARRLEVTPGKLNLVEKYIASDPDLAAELDGLSDDDRDARMSELLEMSVKQINKAIKENREIAKDKIKDKDDQDLDDDIDEEDDNDSIKVDDDDSDDNDSIKVDDDDSDDNDFIKDDDDSDDNDSIKDDDDDSDDNDSIKDDDNKINKDKSQKNDNKDLNQNNPDVLNEDEPDNE